MQIDPHLCCVFSLSLDKDCGLQIVVPAGPKRSLEEGATLDSCLDPGQREVFWEQHLTAGDLILEKKKQSKQLSKIPRCQHKASVKCVHRHLFHLLIFRQRQTIYQLRVRYETLDVLLTWKVS